jgi:hypothetical protein
MLKRTFQRIPRLVRLLIIVGIILLADRLLWPKYSWERHIDPDDVLVAVLPNELYEVHRETEPRLLKRLVRALNGARSWISFGIKWDQEVILHFRQGPSLAIDYGELRDGSEIYFWGQSRNNRFGQLKLYRAGGLRKVLEDIRASEQCRMRPPRLPPQSLSSVVCYAAGSRRAFPGSDTRAQRVLAAINEFLSLTNTSYYDNLGDAAAQLFYEGQAQPERHLKDTTGALLVLDPPLAMHTTVELSSSPTTAEYHKFRTRSIFLSDSISRYGLKALGLSSDEKPNRFYLFFGETPPRSPDKELATKRWNKIIASIESAVREPRTDSQSGRGPSPAPGSGQSPFRPL